MPSARGPRTTTGRPQTSYTLQDSRRERQTGLSIGVYDKNIAAAGSPVARSHHCRDDEQRRAGKNSFTFALTNDTTAPTNGLDTLASNPTGNAYQASAGSAIFFNPNAGGTLTLSDPFTDTQSAPDSVTYPALAANGWTHTLETPTAAPNFTSSTFTWAPAATSPALSLTETDSGGNTAANAVTLTADGTDPAGSVSVPTTSSTLSGIVIDTTNFTDAGSGIATYAITRSNAQAPAIPGVSCPAAGYTGATAVTSPDTVPTDAMCYVYTVTATDNVGNVATLTTSPILVDTSVTASSSSTGVAATTLAWSHTTTNKAMRMLVVGVVAELATNGCQATGVTYGAQALTKIAQAATVTGASVECSSLWYVMAPTVGTNTITVTYQGIDPQPRDRSDWPLEHQTGRSRRVQHQLQRRRSDDDERHVGRGQLGGRRRLRERQREGHSGTRPGSGDSSGSRTSPPRRSPGG